MKIVLLESLAVSDEVLQGYAGSLNKEGHSFIAYEKETDPKILIERAKDADAIILANMPLSGEVIDGCEKLKFIDVAFTGVDHVDLKHAQERGIAVSNASGYSNESVAELVIGMTLSLLRNVRQVEARCREGKTKEGLVGCELKGKTIGVVGTGAIGARVAELFHYFGCEIVAYDKVRKDIPYITYLPLDVVLEKADVVTLHCPLTDETRGLINVEKLALMKEGAYLINAARGPIVDSYALADALNEGRLQGQALMYLKQNHRLRLIILVVCKKLFGYAAYCICVTGIYDIEGRNSFPQFERVDAGQPDQQNPIRDRRG